MHCIHEITPTISDIASTVSVSSIPVYQLYHTTLCMTSHTLYVWHYIQHAWHHTNTLWYHTPICITSHPVYLWHHSQYIWYHPYCFHGKTMTIPDISPIIFDITATPSVLSYPLYGCHHNKYGRHHMWHMYDIIHPLHDNTLTLYDINPQYLWHHNHCIHDIRSPIYDITSTVYDISSPIPVTSQPP